MSAGSIGRGRYTFRPLTPENGALLVRWRSMPHVQEWWGEPGEASTAGDTRVARWIVSLNGRPFAYLQDYDVHGWPEHHFGHLPSGARGVDLYIGEPGMVGHGHGAALVRERLDALLVAGVPAVAVDPHPANVRAIAAYRRAGFWAEGGPIETAWGPALPMVVRGEDR